MTYRLPALYKSDQRNPTIAFLGVASQNEFAALATDRLFDLGFLKAGNGGTAGVTRYRYTKSGDRVDNITDWALARFRKHYSQPSSVRGGEKPRSSGGMESLPPGDAHTDSPHHNFSSERDGLSITKDDIFTYCYAVLQDPVFRDTHADDLRREFPRVPLHDDFWTWREWGKALLELHVNYEQVEPWPLVRADETSNRTPTPKLKSHSEQGLVVVDTQTQLTGIPREAWNYRLGNRSAIDWVLDQHKEKTIRDPTVRAKFNTYRFADHKEGMITLLAKVVRVSIATVAVTEAMRARPPLIKDAAR